MDAREERREHACGEHHPHSRPKGEAPAQGIDEQSQIARVTDDPIDPGGNQCVPGLDGEQPTEPMAEHTDGSDPEGTTGREEPDAQPAIGSPSRVQTSHRSVAAGT